MERSGHPAEDHPGGPAAPRLGLTAEIGPGSQPGPRIAYLVHDLADAAIPRRLRMLASAAAIAVIGFRRSGATVPTIESRPVTELGRTYDASFLQRIRAVATAALHVRSWRAALAGTDLVIARQLEMLVLAAIARPAGAALVYECLDIHRLMLDPGPKGRLLRAIERKLLRRCTRLVVSSPAFLSQYFEQYAQHPPPALLIENKVLAQELGPQDWAAIHTPPPRPDGPPWRIGWFGVLRCRKSLVLLAELARRHPGRVEIVLRGRPSLTAIPDFHDLIAAAAPNLAFLGPYDRARDLHSIHQDLHFTWAIDFFESPGNSEWLLPNRLYEGPLFGCVPLALADVQTGRWLAGHDCGVLLPPDLPAALDQLIATLTPEAYAAHAARIRSVNRAALLDNEASCAALTASIAAGPARLAQAKRPVTTPYESI